MSRSSASIVSTDGGGAAQVHEQHLELLVGRVERDLTGTKQRVDLKRHGRGEL